MLLTALSKIIFLVLRVSPGGPFPRPLTAQEEREALAAMKAGDKSARDKLVEHNLRLVAHVVKKYYAAREDQDDLISIGTIGLIKAVSSFDPDKGARLSTFAARCIENEILMYFRTLKKQQGEISLSDPIDTDKEGNTLSLMDVIAMEDTMSDDLDAKESGQRLRRAINRFLTDQEASILVLRYGLDGKEPRPQREIAGLCGISRSYVSRIEKRAVEKLRAALEGRQVL